MAGRTTLPSPATLGLTHPHAAEDLKELGWDNQASLPILWCLAAAGDPNLALNAIVRLRAGLGERFDDVTERLHTNQGFRARFFALLGGSTALGDHLAANPHLWEELAAPLPDEVEMMQEILRCIDARPAEFAASESKEGAETVPDTAREDLSTPGTYISVMADTTSETSVLATLKHTYRTLIMRVAAHDLAGTFVSRKGLTAAQPRLDFTHITKLTTALADAALTAALALANGKVYRDGPVTSRLAVMAMGKCGAEELNYISDVDVIFVADEADAKATRVAAEFNRIGSACFFEVDAALRPEGKSGALVRTLDSHVKYYKRWAETWEFQAQLKARPQTGYLPLGVEYVEAIGPMVWKASERDSFVEDVQAMRRRVLENVPKDLKHRELKLGVGGLRDVEFAVQLLQLVHGRTDEQLRVLSTVEALDRLVQEGYVGREDGHQLIDAYEFLRLLEHRLQVERFRRTHLMPADDDREGLRWLARISGYASTSTSSATDQMLADLKTVRVRISELHSRLFYRPLLNSVATMSADELRLSPAAAKLQLAALGYGDPSRAFEHLTALASGTSRKARIQAILLPTLMEWLSTTADPDVGLLNYRKLSEAAFDRSWFLRMLRDEGVVGQRLMKILGNSPYTSELIISAPDVVKLLSDGALGPKFMETAPHQANQALVNSSKRHKDPDKAVSIARSLRRVELARIAAADLLGFMPVSQVCRELTLLWNAVLEASLRAEVRAWLLDNDAEVPPARIAVIGMGRLGGMELGYGSDADVMFVAAPTNEVEGCDENEALKWAAGIVDKMRSRLSKPSGDPPLEVDLGLRPEGRSGAVVRTVASYERYYSKWGEVWEMQALLRATFVAGDVTVGRAFLHAVDPFRYPDGGATESTIREIRRMKARVDNERLPRGADRNTHTKLGRGALTDIEWTVQLLVMMHAHQYEELHNTSTLETLDVLEEKEIIEPDKVRTLREAWLFATNARNALVLVRGKRTDQLPQPGPQLAQVAGAAGWAPEENQQFLEAYLKLTRQARRVVDEVFWGEAESFEHD